MIAGGQPAQPEIVKTRPAPAWFGAAGRHDFNYRDTLAIRDHLAASADVRTEFFDGPHQWLGRDAATRAVGWLEMLAIREGRRAADASLVRETFERDMQHAAALEAASRLIEAADTYRALVRTYEGIAPIDDLRVRLAEMASAKPWQAAVEEDEKAARYERSHGADAIRALARLFSSGKLMLARSALNELRRCVRAVAIRRAMDAAAGPDSPRCAVGTQRLGRLYGTVSPQRLTCETSGHIIPGPPGSPFRPPHGPIRPEGASRPGRLS